ncbi:MAG: DNA-binding protein [Acidobacteriota bacterium]
MTESAPEVVCDAGPLIHLDELGCLDLVLDFSRIMIPQAVWSEAQHHRLSVVSHLRGVFDLVSVRIADDPDFQAWSRLFQLHSGEQAALWLLRSYTKAVFLTDDAAARLAAQSVGYRTHGTLAVLLRAIRRGRRTRKEVLGILREIPEKSSLHLRPSLLKEVIAQVEVVGS